jgi:aldose 1-epimerase
VPTGEIAPVAGTPFDFRKRRSVRVPPPASHPQIALTRGFDHCWVLDRQGAMPRAVFARERRAHGGEDQPAGLQVYGAYHLQTSYPGCTPSASSRRISRTRPTTRTSRAASCGPARRIVRS